MFTKLDKAVSPKIEATLTPYEKSARLMLAFARAGKLGSFDPTDLAHLNALETEMLTYEQAVLDATNTGMAGDVKADSAKPADNATAAEPVKDALKELSTEPTNPAAPTSQTIPESVTLKK